MADKRLQFNYLVLLAALIENLKPNNEVAGYSLGSPLNYYHYIYLHTYIHP
jgi:hypothetical protein